MLMEKIKTQSLKMKFFRAIRLESIAWSLRRLQYHLSVTKEYTDYVPSSVKNRTDV